MHATTFFSVILLSFVISIPSHGRTRHEAPTNTISNHKIQRPRVVPQIDFFKNAIRINQQKPSYKIPSNEFKGLMNTGRKERKQPSTASFGLRTPFTNSFRELGGTQKAPTERDPQFKSYPSKDSNKLNESDLVPAMTNGYPGFNYRAEFKASNGETTNAQCGGGLIDAPKKGTGTCRVLTAAHCFDTYKAPLGQDLPEVNKDELIASIKFLSNFRTYLSAEPASTSAPKSIDRSSFNNKDVARTAKIKFADFGEVSAKIIPSANVKDSDSAIIEFQCNNEKAGVPILKVHTSSNGQAIDLNTQERKKLINSKSEVLYGKVMGGPKKYGMYSGEMTDKNGTESTGNTQEVLQPEEYKIQQGDSGSLSIVKINGVWGVAGTLSTSGDNRKKEPIGSYAMVTKNTLKLVENNVSYLKDRSQLKNTTFWKPSNQQFIAATTPKSAAPGSRPGVESIANSEPKKPVNPLRSDELNS